MESELLRWSLLQKYFIKKVDIMEKTFNNLFWKGCVHGAGEKLELRALHAFLWRSDRRGKKTFINEDLLTTSVQGEDLKDIGEWGGGGVSAAYFRVEGIVRL